MQMQPNIVKILIVILIMVFKIIIIMIIIKTNEFEMVFFDFDGYFSKY